MGEVPLATTRELTGWGRAVRSVASVIEPRDPADAARLVATLTGSSPPPARGVLARGLGRSYGDAPLNGGGVVLDMTTAVGGSSLAADSAISLDPATGVVTCPAGTSLDTLLRHIVPAGWFVPVTPGTRYVTVGGAIAADIHGKNHHVAGSFVEHVEWLDLALPGGEVRRLGPTGPDPALFWATAGGMGLTGVVLSAALRCVPVATSRIAGSDERFEDLDALMAGLVAAEARAPYAVAWIDVVARGRRLGRGVVSDGRHATPEELAPRHRADPLAFAPGVVAKSPAVVPPGLLNRWSIAAFNETWFHRYPRRRKERVASIGAFFHPLDGVEGWNRLYGPRGFLQWQMVVPTAADATLRACVDQLAAARAPSFLAVLKRFRGGNDAPMSFPAEGWTLALDIPVAIPGLGALLDRLDELVAEAGGRIYLAKDARLRPELVPIMYPRLDEWRSVRERVDPHGVMQSDQARRLGL